MFLQKCLVASARRPRSAVLTVVPIRGLKKVTKCYFNAFNRKLDPALFSDFSEPMSGSVEFENIIEDRSRQFSDDIASLTSRGFLRFQKAYEPPADAVARFLNLVRTILLSANPKFSNASNEDLMRMDMDDPNLKYEILSKAASEFQHSVPNSMLNVIRTIGSAAKFYDTPIKTTTPFDDLLQMADLPPNLYIQKDYIRFTEDTSHVFGGISAFPKESTIITGLRAKQKYEGYQATPKYKR